MAEAPLIAIPFNPSDPDKLAYILDKCCEHRPWFDDRIWDDYRVRREAANKYLSKTFVNGYVWEVWRADNLLGILLFQDIQFQLSIEFNNNIHFIVCIRKLS